MGPPPPPTTPPSTRRWDQGSAIPWQRKGWRRYRSRRRSACLGLAQLDCSAVAVASLKSNARNPVGATPASRSRRSRELTDIFDAVRRPRTRQTTRWTEYQAKPYPTLQPELPLLEPEFIVLCENRP